MKFKIAAILGIGLLIAVCSARPADDYEYDEAPVAAPPKPTARSNPLLNRRNPLSRPGPAVKSTTSTTTAAPQEEVDEEINEEDAGEEELPLEPSSTTEAARKIKGGIVRPFRSNQDLLATLKKRREQAISNKAHAKATGSESQESAPAETEKHTPKPRPTAGGRGRFSKKENAAPAPVDEQEASSTARSNGGGRRFRN